MNGQGRSKGGRGYPGPTRGKKKKTTTTETKRRSRRARTRRAAAAAKTTTTQAVHCMVPGDWNLQDWKLMDHKKFLSCKIRLSHGAVCRMYYDEGKGFSRETLPGISQAVTASPQRIRITKVDAISSIDKAEYTSVANSRDRAAFLLGVKLNKRSMNFDKRPHRRLVVPCHPCRPRVLIPTEHMVPWVHKNNVAINQFSRFCRANERDQHRATTLYRVAQKK